MCSPAYRKMSNVTADLVGARKEEAAIIVMSFRNQVGGSKVSLGPTMGSGRKHFGSEEQAAAASNNLLGALGLTDVKLTCFWLPGVTPRSDIWGSPSQFSVIIPQTKSNDFSTSASQAGLLANVQKHTGPQRSWPSCRKSKSQHSQDGWRFIWGHRQIIIWGMDFLLTVLLVV